MERNIKWRGINYDDDNDCFYSNYRYEFDDSLKSALHTILNSWEDIVHNKYEDAYLGDFHEGLACVRRRGLVGYIDILGEYVISPTFTAVNDFHNNIAVVRIGRERSTKPGMWGVPGKCGVINRSGNWILPPIYTSIGYFDDKLRCTTNSNIIEFRTYDGELCLKRNSDILIKSQYPDILLCKELIKISNNGKYGYVNQNNEIVIPCKYRYISEFENGLAIVKHRHKYGFINEVGEMVIAARYSELAHFHEGYAAATRNGESYYINEKGERAIL